MKLGELLSSERSEKLLKECENRNIADVLDYLEKERESLLKETYYQSKVTLH